MNNTNLEKILYVVSDTPRGSQGFWEFFIGETPMICMTDEANNRMRIISPVKEMIDVTLEEAESAMEANFHSALDVRYAVAEGVMWVAYIHPLEELSKEQAIDAVTQVYNAVHTFGSSYSSTDLIFPKSDTTSVQGQRKH